MALRSRPRPLLLYLPVKTYSKMNIARSLSSHRSTQFALRKNIMYRRHFLCTYIIIIRHRYWFEFEECYNCIHLSSFSILSKLYKFLIYMCVYISQKPKLPFFKKKNKLLTIATNLDSLSNNFWYSTKITWIFEKLTLNNIFLNFEFLDFLHKKSFFLTKS